GVGSLCWARRWWLLPGRPSPRAPAFGTRLASKRCPRRNANKDSRDEPHSKVRRQNRSQRSDRNSNHDAEAQGFRFGRCCRHIQVLCYQSGAPSLSLRSLEGQGGISSEDGLAPVLAQTTSSSRFPASQPYRRSVVLCRATRGYPSPIASRTTPALAPPSSSDRR